MELSPEERKRIYEEEKGRIEAEEKFRTARVGRIASSSITIAWSIVFLVFGLLYRFKKNDTWTAFRVGVVGPLISFFSFEDIIYYPMHGETPFGKVWDWLPHIRLSGRGPRPRRSLSGKYRVRESTL